MGSLSASVTLENATPYHHTSTQLTLLLLYNGLCIIGHFLCDTHTHTFMHANEGNAPLTMLTGKSSLVSSWCNGQLLWVQQADLDNLFLL